MLNLLAHVSVERASAEPRKRPSAHDNAHNHKRMLASVNPQAKVEPISTCKRRARQREAAQAAERARQRAQPQVHACKRKPTSEGGTYKHM